MVKLSEARPPHFGLTESASPGTPATGLGDIYAATDGTLHYINDGGTDLTLAGTNADHGGLTGLSDDDHPQYVKDSEFTATGDTLRGTGSGTFEAVKNSLAESTAPDANDDSGSGYSVGSRWIDTTADKEYVCLDATSTAAVWTETTGGGGGSITVQDESGTVSDSAVTVIRVPDNTLVDNGVGDVSLREVPHGTVSAIVERSTAQAIATSAYDQVEFDATPLKDTDGIWDSANNRFTVPTGMDGVWHFEAFCQFQSAGTQYVTFYLNGAQHGPQNRLAGIANATETISHTIDLVAGDYIEVWCYNTGGGNISSTSTHQMNRFSCFYVGGGVLAGMDTDSQVRTSGDVTINSTTWAAVDTGLDLSVAAQAGDVLAVSISLAAENEAVEAYFDAATMVSASPVNYISGGGGATDSGIAGLLCLASQYQFRAATTLYTVVAGDIENNAVALRLQYRTLTATNRTVRGAHGVGEQPLHFSVVNLKSGAQRGERKGTAFPSGPATNERFIRTDIDNMEFFYDGTRWLTTNIFTASAQIVTGSSQTGDHFAWIALPKDYQVYLMEWDILLYMQTGGGVWVATLQTLTFDETAVTLDSQSSSGQTGARYYTYTNQLDDVVDGTGGNSGSNITALRVFFDEQSGTSNLLSGATIYFRKIAT